MSESLPECLSKFTPSAGRLDRDALLFTAGRNSARPSRVWQGLSSVLATTQLLMIVCLWPYPADLRPGAADSMARKSISAGQDEPVEQRLPATFGQRHIWSVRSEPDESMLDRGISQRIVLTDSEPQLRIFGLPPDSILN